MEKDNKGTRSLSRGLAILNCFSGQETSLSLTEIATKTNLNASTVSRLLQTLVDMKYLQRDYQRKYSMGTKLHDLAAIIKNKSTLHSIALPILTNLRDMFDETVSLYIVKKDNRVCIESIESNQALRRSVEYGEMLPLSRGATGYILLAWLPYKQRRRILQKSPHITEELLSKIRQAGYVENDGLHEPGVYAVAAPVFNDQGTNIAAISISGPSNRINQSMRTELTDTVMEAAMRISNLLGFKNAKK